MKKVLLILVIIHGLAHCASAQDSLRVTTNQALPSPDKALAYSLVATFLPIPFTGGFSLFIGPSIGYFYGECPGQGFKGLGIRLGAGILTVAGLVVNIGKNGSFENLEGNKTLGNAMMLAGGFTFIFSSIHDLVGIKKAIRNHNQARQNTIIRLIPSYIPNKKAGGLTLVFTFR
jgi:hypothetical protein